MNPDVKKLWLADLRSGEFAQTNSALKVDEAPDPDDERPQPIGYCCLGVLTERYRRETGNGRWEKPSEYFPPYFWWNTGEVDALGQPITASEGHELPEPVKKWAGLDANDPVLTYSLYTDLDGNPQQRAHTTLASENDSGKTFAQIANIIEEKF
jgi:hypothetical protein